MNFLYPQFLFGLLAIGIPIIIHLFNLQRTKKVYFSNTAFLKNVQSISRRSIKIKNFLILLARILFITFLVLAFCQPFLSNEKTVDQAGLVNIYVDNSLSTQSNIGNDRILDLSVKGAEALAKDLAQNTIINAYTNDFGNVKGQLLNKKRIEEFLTEIDFSPESKTLNEVINKKTFIRDSDINSRKKAVYVFSDFQKSTLGDLRNLQIDSMVNYTLIPVTPEETSNIYIDSIWLNNPYINVNENNLIKARVVNSGGQAKENVLLKLSIDGSQVATSSVNLGAHSNEEASFNFNVSTGGIKRGVISISDYPVIFDNDYYFSFKTVSKIKVLQLTSAVSTPYIEKVFQDKFLFEVSSKNINNLNYNIVQQYDLLILDNLENIPPGFEDALSNFVRNSGGIMIIPSIKIDISSFNRFLNQYSIFIEKAISGDSTISVQELQQPDLKNPFYNGIFESTKERIIVPSEKQVVRWNNIGIDILRFKTGKSFLTQVNTENSKLFLFAGNLRYEKGFALNALFVPTFYKIALLSNSRLEKLSYKFEDKVVSISVPETNKNSVFKLHKDSLEIIPNQRIAGKNLIFDIPETNITPGHYELRLGAEVLEAISFNYSEKESIMSFYTAEELREILGKYKNITVINSISNGNVKEELESAHNNLPLWKICLLLALLFLFIEILLLRFYKVYESPAKVS